jgi:hypothetical protein
MPTTVLQNHSPFETLFKCSPDYTFLRTFGRGRVKAAHPKTKGRREVLNLVSSINYGDSSAASRLRKGNAHVV